MAASEAKTIDEPIAVVGMGCRLPGADGVEQLWSLLSSGTEALTPLPEHRWHYAHLYCDAAGEPGKTYCRLGGFVEDGDRFDAAFFEIDGHEAARMDPQQGMALEVVWQALEQGGFNPRDLPGTDTGVFLGVSTRDYDRRLSNRRNSVDVRTATGAAGALIANRVSYALGLSGPSLAVDAACASSLTSVHLACQSLRQRECDLALAGGVQLILSPANIIAYSQGGLLAKDGKSKSFASDADGFCCGEGAGVVVLKRLPDALRERDNIWAVIAGSAVNHNGFSNGLMAPYGKAQQKLIQRTLQRSNIEPRQIGYVEAHSPGTQLGDIIEARALASVIGNRQGEGEVCYLGSIKSNFGHLEAAAGIASLLKTILSVHRGIIPKTLHVSEVNRHLPLAKSRLQIATETVNWPKGYSRRCAGVSAFSFGGGNAHVLVSQAPALPAVKPPANTTWAVPISARNESALTKLVESYFNYCSENLHALNDTAYFARFCRTVAGGRAPMQRRLCFVVESAEELYQSLKAHLLGIENFSAHGGKDSAKSGRQIVLDYSGDCWTQVIRASTGQWKEQYNVCKERVQALLQELKSDGESPLHTSELLTLLLTLSQWGVVVNTIAVAIENPLRHREGLLGSQVLQQRFCRLANAPLPKLVKRDGERVSQEQSSENKKTTNHQAFVLSPREDISVGRPCSLADMLAHYYVSGGALNWRRIYAFVPGPGLALPTYPFQRQRYWEVPDEQVPMPDSPVSESISRFG